MRIWQHLPPAGESPAPSCIAIGTFDGVHAGHQALIRAAVVDSERRGAVSLVFTFDRHPAEVFAPARAPAYITTPAQRAAAIGDLGVDALVVARFDVELRALTPDRFVADILVGRLRARAVLTGDDFRFGRNHAGDIDTLRGLAARHGFDVAIVEPVVDGGERVSSTRVRRCIQAGEVEAARRMLGRWYALEGTVVRGDQLGRRLGYPTANLQLTTRQVMPADAVYAGWARTRAGTVARAALSIGTRPTIDGRKRVVEAYLLDFEGDLYGGVLEVALCRRLRGQQRFASVDALVEQMAADVAATRALDDAERPSGWSGRP